MNAKKMRPSGWLWLPRFSLRLVPTPGSCSEVQGRRQRSQLILYQDFSAHYPWSYVKLSHIIFEVPNREKRTQSSYTNSYIRSLSHFSQLPASMYPYVPNRERAVCKQAVITGYGHVTWSGHIGQASFEMGSFDQELSGLTLELFDWAKNIVGGVVLGCRHCMRCLRIGAHGKKRMI